MKRKMKRKPKRQPLDHLRTAVGCTSEGFPVGPDNLLRFAQDTVCMTSDPAQAKGWWTHQFKTLSVLLPLGEPSRVIAVQIAKAYGKRKVDGFPALFRLQKQYGTLPATAFFEDGGCWTLLYETPNDLEVQGQMVIATGITVSGHGEWITLPPYYCPVNPGRVVEWPSKYQLTKANLATAPDWLIQKIRAANILKAIAEGREADKAA